MSHLDPIYAVWDGNAEAMGVDIGEQGVKTRQWRNRGNIPSDYWPRIIEAARKKGIELEWSQFVRPSIEAMHSDSHAASDTDPAARLSGGNGPANSAPVREAA